MSSRSSITVVVFLLISLFSSSIVTACSDHYPPPPPPPKPNCAPPPPPITPSPLPKTQSHPTPIPKPASPNQKCPKNTFKLAVCGNTLGGLTSFSKPTPRNHPCCNIIEGLLDLEAAVCLCTAIKAHALHIINLDVDVSLTMILNNCGKKIPSGFKCAY